MEDKSDTLRQLETLYHQAKTPPERAILLQTMRIVNPEECSRLEAALQREQVRSMPIEEIVTLLSGQKGLSAEEARHAVADLIFDQLIDRSRLELADATVAPLSPAPPREAVPAPRPVPPPPPRPSPPKSYPAVPGSTSWNPSQLLRRKGQPRRRPIRNHQEAAAPPSSCRGASRLSKRRQTTNEQGPEQPATVSSP